MSEDVSGLVSQLTLTSKKGKVIENEKKIEEVNGTPKIFDTFPWLREFYKLCRSAVGSKNIKVLEMLLSFFVEQVAESIKDCYKKKFRAAKLRAVVNKTLVYFNFFYQELKFEVEDLDEKQYLNQMIVLMAMYLDLEIKASKTGKDSLKKIGQLMTSSLYVFLDHSEDHMAEAILRAKLIIKENEELCAPVLSKILKEGKCFIKDEATYVKYLLTFKLWKKITSKKAVKKTIIRMAVNKLDPPPQLVDSIRKVCFLPKMPKNNKNMTLFYMEEKFDFINAKLEFLKKFSVSNNTSKTFSDQKTSLQLDKRKPRVPHFPSVQRENEMAVDDGEGVNDVEFIEATSQKDSKPVIMITIDSDEQTSSANVSCSVKKENDFTVSCKEKFIRKVIKEEKDSEKSCLKNKKQRIKTKRSKKVPEKKLEKSLKTRDVSSSTKENDGITSRLRSPEHAIADSTSNHVDSPTEESHFRSPKHQVYEIHSNTSWDDLKVEPCSSESFDTSNLSARRSSADSATKNGEISSTRQNSVPSSFSVDSINNLNKPSKPYNSELPTTFGKIRNLSAKELRYKSSRTISTSDSTVSNSSAADSSSKTFSPIAKSLTFEDKTDTDSNLSEKENLTVQSSLSISSSRPEKNHYNVPNYKSDSTQSSNTEYKAIDKVEHKIKVCDYNSEVNKLGETAQHSKQSVENSSKSRNQLQNIIDYKCHKTKDSRPNEKNCSQKSLIHSPTTTSKKVSSDHSTKQSTSVNQQKDVSESKSKDSTKKVFQIKQLQGGGMIRQSSAKREGRTKDINPGEKGNSKTPNSLLTSHNVDQLINCSKKVEYENVAKSYKIVKSSALKNDCTSSKFNSSGKKGGNPTSNGVLGQANTTSRTSKISESNRSGKLKNNRAGHDTPVSEISQRKRALQSQNVKVKEKKTKLNHISSSSKFKTEDKSVEESPIPEVALEEFVRTESGIKTDNYPSTSGLKEPSTGNGTDQKSHSQSFHQNSRKRTIIFKMICDGDDNTSQRNSRAIDRKTDNGSRKLKMESIASHETNRPERTKLQGNNSLGSTTLDSTTEKIFNSEKEGPSSEVFRVNGSLKKTSIQSSSLYSANSLDSLFSTIGEDQKERCAKNTSENDLKTISDQTTGKSNNESVKNTDELMMPTVARHSRLRARKSDLIYSKSNRSRTNEVTSNDAPYFEHQQNENNNTDSEYFILNQHIDSQDQTSQHEHVVSSSSKAFSESDVHIPMNSYQQTSFVRGHPNYEHSKMLNQDCEEKTIGDNLSESNIPGQSTAFANLPENIGSFKEDTEAPNVQLQQTKNCDNGLVSNSDISGIVSRDCIIGEMRSSEDSEIKEKFLSLPFPLLDDDYTSHLFNDDLSQYFYGITSESDAFLRSYYPQQLSESVFESEFGDSFITETAHGDIICEKLESQDEDAKLLEENFPPPKTPRINNSRVYTPVFCPSSFEEAQNLSDKESDGYQTQKSTSKARKRRTREAASTIVEGGQGKIRKLDEVANPHRRYSERLHGIPPEYDAQPPKTKLVQKSMS